MRFRTVMLLLAAVLLFAVPACVYTQDLAPTNPDPIQQLRLTPEQRQRIRIIFAENKDERQVCNRKLREANIALEQALDAESPDENLIDQRINELAAAQAAQTRMRIRSHWIILVLRLIVSIEFFFTSTDFSFPIELKTNIIMKKKKNTTHNMTIATIFASTFLKKLFINNHFSICRNIKSFCYK